MRVLNNSLFRMDALSLCFILNIIWWKFLTVRNHFEGRFTISPLFFYYRLFFERFGLWSFLEVSIMWMWWNILYVCFCQQTSWKKENNNELRYCMCGWRLMQLCPFVPQSPAVVRTLWRWSVSLMCSLSAAEFLHREKWQDASDGQSRDCWTFGVLADRSRGSTVTFSRELRWTGR